MENLPTVAPKAVDFAIADLTIYTASLLPSLVITRVPGKTAPVTWPIIISYIAMRFLADEWQTAHRDSPEIPDTVAILTNTGSTACISPLIMAVIYEVKIIIPYKRRWSGKLLLAVANVTNTFGIGITTCGGSPNGKTHTLNSVVPHMTGCILKIIVIGILMVWLGVTSPRLQSVFPSQMQQPTAWLFWTSAVSMPFFLIHLITNTTLTFNLAKARSLGPVRDAFSMKLWFSF